jgi:flagellin-like protein
MKILKSKKALSPVVASIILIAVTVAVSIAVAAWMGALTFTFMKSESYNVIAIYFETNSRIVVRIQNTGSAQFTVDVNAKVNGVSKTLDAQVNIAAAAVQNVTIPNVAWSNGNQYSVELTTTQGTKIPWVAVAPQT